MTKLVSELVTLSRLDEDLPLPNKERFSLSNAAWETVDIYQSQAKGRGKKMTIDIAENVEIFGDKSAVQQMLSVLLDNAVRYSNDEGEIRFSVYTKKTRRASKSTTHAIMTPRLTSTAYSTASTVPTAPEALRPAAPVSASPSPRPLPNPTAARSRPSAPTARA